VRPEFLEDESDPASGRWFWAYTVIVANHSETTVQLLARYWQITNAAGQVEEVRGPGVIGEQPVLEPGDSFQYTSGCPLNTSSGTMVGHYVMQADTGEQFEARIPGFSLDLPDMARTLN
ncbi:MAG: Co2+/Mg2+ efflux protein ApaG, partial [Pseudomonadota bacterium]